MSELDEIRNRVDALESEVSRLREDGAATRTLAAMADRDASEVRGALRSHTQALNALRETQVEQGDALTEQASTLRAVAEAVGALAVGQQEQAQTLTEVVDMLRHLTDRD